MPYPKGMTAYRSAGAYVPSHAPTSPGGPGLSNGPKFLLGAVDELVDWPWSPKLPPSALSRLGLARVIPWLGAAMTVYELYKLWNSMPNYGGNNNSSCTAQSGPVGAFAGGTCLFPFHLASGHSAPVFAATATSVSVANAHVCVPNGAWIGQASRRTISTFSGVLWTAASGKYKPAWKPHNAPFEFTPNVPEWAPAFNPWFQPIKNPMPDLVPVPYPVLPDRTAPEIDPDPSPIPNPRPPLRPPPRPGPVVAPPVAPRPAPGAGGGFVNEPIVPRIRSPRTQAPAGRGAKEVKMKAGNAKVAGLVWSLANTVTESKDLLEALWDALPRRFKTRDKGRADQKGYLRSHKPPVAQMFKDVYGAIGNMTAAESSEFWNKAVDNIVANQIEDYVMGKAGKALGDASAAAGRPFGFGVGPAL